MTAGSVTTFDRLVATTPSPPRALLCAGHSATVCEDCTVLHRALVAWAERHPRRMRRRLDSLIRPSAAAPVRHRKRSRGGQVLHTLRHLLGGAR